MDSELRLAKATRQKLDWKIENRKRPALTVSYVFINIRNQIYLEVYIVFLVLIMDNCT